jgi:replicative DNA helicase
MQTISPQKAYPSPIRMPPQNLEAEKAFLGSLLLRAEAFYEVADTLSPQALYSNKHKTIYEAMLDLHNRHDPIDLLSLSSRLEEKGALEPIGGRGYLGELINIVPSASNISHYASLVQKKYMMRRLIAAAETVGSLGYDEAEDLELMLDRAEKTIFDVTNNSNNNKVIELKSLLGEAWERLDRLHKTKGELRGVPTGFTDLDDKLSGLQKSDLIILAARPSMGKTSLALDIARQASVNHNTSVGLFSLEMSSQQLVDRMLASEAKVDAWKLRTGRLTLEQLRDGLDKLSKAPIYIDDQPGSNILKMRSVSRRLKSEKNLGLIIIDYLQLMTPMQNRPQDSEVQQVTEISRSLKTLAREMDVPVVALSQLSRAVESRGGRPRLSDLRSSGSIEQDADVVMFIHREDKYKDNAEKSNIVEILIEKHRNGPTGKVELYFDDKKSTFLSVDKNDFGEF